MKNRKTLALITLLAFSSLPVTRMNGGICGNVPECPDPSVLGGLTSCLTKPGCVATPGSQPLRTDGPCSYSREFSNRQTATEFAVIDGKNCYRQYDVYEVYDLFRWWKVYECTYKDGNGPTAAQCTFCIDKSSSFFRGENVDGIEPRFMGMCTEYVSYSNAQWHCNGILT